MELRINRVRINRSWPVIKRKGSACFPVPTIYSYADSHCDIDNPMGRVCLLSRCTSHFKYRFMLWQWLVIIYQTHLFQKMLKPTTDTCFQEQQPVDWNLLICCQWKSHITFGNHILVCLSVHKGHLVVKMEEMFKFVHLRNLSTNDIIWWLLK